MNDLTENQKPKVLILIGSKTDEPVMQETINYLNWFGIKGDLIIASAHRDAEKCVKLSKEAKKNGYTCIIAAAGMAAAIPGVVAANSDLPVLGVPLEGGLMNGVDALYSIVQMPAGIPVGTLAVGKAGARNSAVLAARIIALNNEKIAKKLKEFKKLGFKIK